MFFVANFPPPKPVMTASSTKSLGPRLRGDERYWVLALLGWVAFGVEPAHTTPFISCRDDRRAVQVAQGRFASPEAMGPQGPPLTNLDRPARWPA